MELSEVLESHFRKLPIIVEKDRYKMRQFEKKKEFPSYPNELYLYNISPKKKLKNSQQLNSLLNDLIPIFPTDFIDILEIKKYNFKETEKDFLEIGVIVFDVLKPNVYFICDLDIEYLQRTMITIFPDYKTLETYKYKTMLKIPYSFQST